MLEWYRALVALRQATPDLLDPRLSRVACRFDSDQGWFVMERGSVALAFNLADAERKLELDGEPLLASPGAGSGHGCVQLGPDAVIVVGKRG